MNKKEKKQLKKQQKELNYIVNIMDKTLVHRNNVLAEMGDYKSAGAIYEEWHINGMAPEEYEHEFHFLDYLGDI